MAIAANVESPVASVGLLAPVTSVRVVSIQAAPNAQVMAITPVTTA